MSMIFAREQLLQPIRAALQEALPHHSYQLNALYCLVEEDLRGITTLDRWERDQLDSLDLSNLRAVYMLRAQRASPANATMRDTCTTISEAISRAAEQLGITAKQLSLYNTFPVNQHLTMSKTVVPRLIATPVAVPASGLDPTEELTHAWKSFQAFCVQNAADLHDQIAPGIKALQVMSPDLFRQRLAQVQRNAGWWENYAMEVAPRLERLEAAHAHFHEAHSARSSPLSGQA